MKRGFSSMLASMSEAGRRALLSKVPEWEGVQVEVPSSINLQQASGSAAARLKAELLAGCGRIADLTGGLGVDSWAFAQTASALWYNERDAALRSAVERNFALLGLKNVEFNSFDIQPGGGEWLRALSSFAPDAIYADPARRDSFGKKVFIPEDCSPDVVALMPLLLGIAPTVLVKMSPMADITMLSRRFEGCLSELVVAGVSGECKELLCVCRASAVFSGVRLWEDGEWYAGGSLSGAESCDDRGYPAGPGADTGESPGKEAACRPRLLFVPSPSLVKSGLPLPASFVRPDPGAQLYTAPYSFRMKGFGRYFELLEDLPFGKESFRRIASEYGAAEVTARNLPLGSEELRVRMGLKPGGRVHVFAFCPGGERRLLVCKKVLSPEKAL